MLGEKIKAARTKRGFTLKELGSRVGLTHAGISKIENGKTEPNKPSLIALARTLNSNFGESWLDEYLKGNDAPRSKKEIAQEMTAAELISLKFPGGMRRQTKAQAELLAKMLDAEVERIKKEGW